MPDNGMVERRDELFGQNLRVIEHVLDPPHRRAGHSLAENLFPFARAALCQCRAQFRDQLGGVFGAAAHRDAARILRQFRPADQFAQRGPEMVGVDGDVERAVFGRVDAG